MRIVCNKSANIKIRIRIIFSHSLFTFFRINNNKGYEWGKIKYEFIKTYFGKKFYAIFLKGIPLNFWKLSEEPGKKWRGIFSTFFPTSLLDGEVEKGNGKGNLKAQNLRPKNSSDTATLSSWRPTNLTTNYQTKKAKNNSHPTLSSPFRDP